MTIRKQDSPVFDRSLHFELKKTGGIICKLYSLSNNKRRKKLANKKYYRRVIIQLFSCREINLNSQQPPIA